MALRRINKVRAWENSAPNRPCRRAVPRVPPGATPERGEVASKCRERERGSPSRQDTYARLANRGALLCRRSWRISTGIRRPTVALVRTGMTSSTGRRRSWGCVEPAPHPRWSEALATQRANAFTMLRRSLRTVRTRVVSSSLISISRRIIPSSPRRCDLARIRRRFPIRGEKLRESQPC